MKRNEMKQKNIKMKWNKVNKTWNLSGSVVIVYRDFLQFKCYWVLLKVIRYKQLPEMD